MTRKSPPKRITIHDVASDAGVSFSAVSKVLRDAYGVSDALRARVNESIAKLGYTPNTAARGMRGKTHVIGVIFPDMRNPYFADVLSGISAALERTTYQMVQGIVQHSTEAALVQSMMNMQLDGLIIVGSISTSEELSGVAARLPLVVDGHHLPNATSFDTVNNDDAESGRIAVRHLVEQGYRKIAMLSLETHNGSVIERREAGYEEAMRAAGLGRHIEIARAPQSLRDIQVVTQSLIEKRVEAIFCWTDYVALEAMSVAGSLGLSIPRDVAIVGHDNTMYCGFEQNSLTSLDQSGEQSGLQAARLLIERIEGRQKAEHFLIHPRLVARRSSAAPA
ncbi:LacI family DNA-binding transcriptional regulator [Devosia elaeis]|uniref:LacI family transcriptional regulator n=1 Tax=Devosia elaeis TaxID=1770058 RepID=A0A178I465_9HYPH|nr:LacI family DNA-binding transcriptional regulator [Devosia elaeis]OAM83681.1 LacI family transcriptional regulator [Devosia elaeis]